jgi:hypothetical protein
MMHLSHPRWIRSAAGCAEGRQAHPNSQHTKDQIPARPSSERGHLIQPLPNQLDPEALRYKVSGNFEHADARQERLVQASEAFNQVGPGQANDDEENNDANHNAPHKNLGIQVHADLPAGLV